MRFASLTLERYGHFEDRELSFRVGPPDLHIIYGGNEAGKTTSMAAVSDLLFGFPARSNYNFIYDYSLLRVGAVLEDDDRTLSCRRKKGTTSTLLDGDDRPIDEGTLLAMLRGQTRETFGLSFSLDQEGLREGGRAMVEARNDLGRALFAAGSGMTGVSDQLAALESEADAIWGPRASSKRSFTIAQRDLDAHSRAARDHALKPKTWLDAKGTVAATHESLTEAQERRDKLLAEVSRIERIRRIAPSVRLRADHLEALEDHSQTVDISPQHETAAELAMGEVDAARRAKAAAEKLVAETEERICELETDPAILAQAERVDDLLTASGAVSKARQDKVRLDGDLAAGAGVVKRLREEGSTVGEPPTRIVSSKFRALALQHAEDMAALRQFEESEEALEQRRAAVKTDVEAEPVDLAPIVAAVDAARALGVDADARCASAQRRADAAASSLEDALARLAPWTGNAQALAVLPRLTRDEIDEARTVLSEIAAEIEREAASALRAREEEAALGLEMEQLSSGTAVSAEVIAAARGERSDRWQPIREQALSGVSLPAAKQAVSDFEAAMSEADDQSDQRFMAADESSRLAAIGQRRAKLLLEASQADARSVGAADRGTLARAAWEEKLIGAGYPKMEPARYLGWLTDRDTAETAAREAASAADEAATIRRRREEVRAELAQCLGAAAATGHGDELAPLLIIGERMRSDAEEAAQRRRLNEAADKQIEQDVETLGRRRTRVEAAIATHSKQWAQLLDESGISLDMAGAITVLDLLDELRAAIAAQAELQARIDGMERDAGRHDADIMAAADSLGIEPRETAGERLALMRARLAAARAAANVATSLNDTIESRTAEATSETAKIEVALSALAPWMEETGSSETGELGAAIERSRAARSLRDAVVETETRIKAEGDGKTLEELLDSMTDVDIDSLAARTQSLAAELADRNEEVEVAAAAYGDAKRTFASLEGDTEPAANAASDAEQARAELSVLSEQFILKRAQAITLRWAIEQYRERHQDPLLFRASQIFSTLTTGRYASLRIDNDGGPPRLMGLRDDGRTVVEIGAMSEGTTDQLFLALRLAAVEQSVAAGVRMPFLADDLFVNFDDERSEAGFRVLAELARTTQVLFFTHHPHLASIAREVVGGEIHSECALS